MLLGHGWQALEHRWHCRWGEIDLLVAKPERLLLVEVKARSRVGPDGWGADGCCSTWMQPADAPHKVAEQLMRQPSRCL